MSIALRGFLVLGSVLTLLFVIRSIRRASVRIEDTLFWILFCGILLLVSIFPELTFFFTAMLGIQSPINGVFLLIIFILLINQFYLTLKVSKLLIRQKELAQKIALDNKALLETEEPKTDSRNMYDSKS